MNVVFRRTVFLPTFNEDSSPEISKAQKPSLIPLSLFHGLDESQATLKTEKLQAFFLKFGKKIRKHKADLQKSAFIRLCLLTKRAILTKIFFNKLRHLLLKKSLDAIYTFFNRARDRKSKLLWMTERDFEAKKGGLSLKNWDFSRKNLPPAELNKMRKILLDFSVSGDSPYENNINFQVIQVFLSHKFSLRLLRLFMVNHNRKQVFEAFAAIMGYSCRHTPPKALQEYLGLKMKERNEMERMIAGFSPKRKMHKTHEKVIKLHNQELNRIDKRITQSMPLRVRENLILSNWGGQILQEISRHYRREYLIVGFSKLRRNYEAIRYKRKMLFNLYENYRVRKIRDLTVKFMQWKMIGGCYETSKTKGRKLALEIMNLVDKKKKSYLFQFLLRIPGSPTMQPKKIQAMVLILRVLMRKVLVLKGYVWKRAHNEEVIEEMGKKIKGVGLMQEISERLTIKRGWRVMKDRSFRGRAVESLVKRVEFVMRIRRVLVFYRMLAFARAASRENI